MEVESSYIEVKVTFIHIVVLLVGVILIGTFLFYLGYQAGKSSTRNQILQAELPETQEKTDEIQLQDREDKTPGKKQTSIKDEIKLHRLPPSPDTTSPDTTPPGTTSPSASSSPSSSSSTPSTKSSSPSPTGEKDEEKEPIKAKPLKKEYFFMIQVGAFSEYANAKSYAEHFARMGYPTEIDTTVKGKKKIHRVRAGNFKTMDEAKKAQEKLELLEKKKFSIVKSG